MKIKIISWNVRGVNDPDKRRVIKSFLRSNRVDLVCLQETKVHQMNNVTARSLGVGRFLVAFGRDWHPGSFSTFQREEGPH